MTFAYDVVSPVRIMHFAFRVNSLNVSCGTFRVRDLHTYIDLNLYYIVCLKDIKETTFRKYVFSTEMSAHFCNLVKQLHNAVVITYQSFQQS